IAAARVFAGYAGWGAGQLEAEIAAGAWLIVRARLADLFGEAPAAIWRRALRRLGPGYLLFSTLSRTPELD
ncbi:MAG: YqgE/AlgH family protein, partial [Candidatus Limnocylindrales bacterium]